MNRFLVVFLLLTFLAACKLPEFPRQDFTTYPQPTFLAAQGGKTTRAAQKVATLTEADMAFLDWIQKPGAKDFYIWNESKTRTIPQPELDFLNWIITPGAKKYFISQHIVEGQNIVLNNGVIEVHLHGKWGGSIVHVSRARQHQGRNLVNSSDLGRQIQQSYYAGTDMTFPDQNPAWSPWPWNPIQSGDFYGNHAQMRVTKKTEKSVTVETVPMFWDRRNVPAKCATMASTVSIDRNVVHVRSSMKTDRTCDIRNSIPRHQEMPAVYTTGMLARLKTYIGNNPCTGEPLTRITRKPLFHDPAFPWNYWPHELYPGNTTEKWAAAVDGDGYGLGIYMAKAELFIGGHAPSMVSPAWNPKNPSATYFSPLRTIKIKPGDTVAYEYYLIVGSLDEIRGFACEMAK